MPYGLEFTTIPIKTHIVVASDNSMSNLIIKKMLHVETLFKADIAV